MSDAIEDGVTAPPLARPPAPPPPAAKARLPLSEFVVRRRGIVRGLVLTIATLLSLFGTMGQFFFVDAADDAAKARAAEMRDIETRTETLRNAQHAYFNAQVQGNMLFALNPADASVNKGIVGNLYQLAITDRGFPFRSILGELAIAGAIEFKPVNDQYNELRAKAAGTLDYESFTAVGDFERQALDAAFALHGKLQERYWAAAAEKDAAEAEAKRRRLVLLGAASVATCLFLIANLLGVKD
ncbi:MAG: hypothetical protein U5J99_14980 [Parvularculaceae bacterium]|nr:hypothetical protein [Parvularculaceae bacterium]